MPKHEFLAILLGGSRYDSYHFTTFLLLFVMRKTILEKRNESFVRKSGSSKIGLSGLAYLSDILQSTNPLLRSNWDLLLRLLKQ